MNLEQMGYFIAIVSEGSISAAAKTLHISQPPLGTQMRFLEEELGLTLFQHGSRGIPLTDAGKVLYEWVQGILDMTGAVLEGLERMGQRFLGSLCLGMISSVGTEPIIGKITVFRQKHPGMGLRIYEGNAYQLLNKLNTGIIETAIVRSPFPEEPYGCFYLSGDVMIAMDGRCSFPRLGADTISLKEPYSYPSVVYHRWEGVLNRLSALDCPDCLYINDNA